MSYYTDALTTPTIATDSLLKRTVADEIRRLLPGNNIVTLVAPGIMGKDKNIVQKKGMIRKRRVENRKYERFTWSPAAVQYTVATFTDVGSSSGFTVDSADGLRPTYGLLNTSNMTVCRIGSVSSTTIKGTSVGSEAFTAEADDVLILMAPYYPQNSSDPYIRINDEDNHYGYTQIARFPIAISGSNKVEARFGPEYWSRVKMNSLINASRTVEATALFGTAPSSEPTTSDSILSDTFQSTTGIYNWSSTSYDAQNNLTYSKFRNNMVLAMHESMRGQNQMLRAYCSQAFYGTTMDWINDKVIINDSGKKDVFGAISPKFMTTGPTVELLVHDLFSRGNLQSTMLVVDPSLLEYVFLRDRDFKPYEGIQDNDVDGIIDEVRGEFGMDVLDGGSSVLKVTNIS